MLGHMLKRVLSRKGVQPDAPAADAPSTDSAIYRSEVFAVSGMEQAKAIILTPEDGMSTEQRWETETPYLAKSAGEALQLTEDSLVLDYGCGIGRMSKALIERYGCSVLGVDISVSMRQLAPQYVANPNFSSVSPDVFAKMVARGLRVDCGIAVWVLQHCPDVITDIALIKSSLKPDAGLYIVNNNLSAIPTDKGWVNDGVNIQQLLENAFSVSGYSRLPTAATTPFVAENTFLAYLKNDKPET